MLSALWGVKTFRDYDLGTGVGNQIFPREYFKGGIFWKHFKLRGDRREMVSILKTEIAQKKPHF
jgi:hypothetical protein